MTQLRSFPKRPLEVRFSPISFSNGSRAGASSGVDAFGCLCSLRARSALDGVSWVRWDLVEIAVGLEGPQLHNLRHLPLPP